MLYANGLLATMAAAVIMVAILIPQYSEAEAIEYDEKIEKLYRLNFCGRVIDRILEKLSPSDLKDREKVYKIGYKKFMPKNRKRDPIRFEVASAWNRVRETISGKRDCSSDIAENIAFLSICFNMGVFHTTMGYDVREYADKCAPNYTYWDDLFDKVQNTEKFSKEDHDKVKKFIDDKFLQTYSDENGADGKCFGRGCCSTKKAWKSTFNSFLSVGLDIKNNPSALQDIAEDPDRIEDIYEEKIFKPCTRYLPGFHWYMAILKQVAEIMPHDKFLNGLKKDVRDEIFRYKFCSSLLRSKNDNLNEQLTSIAWNVLYPGMDYGRVSCFY